MAMILRETLADDETNVTDIELLADGRVCVFGASIEVLVVLNELQRGADKLLKERLKVARPNDRS